MDLLNLRAVLTLDKAEYEKGLTDAGETASSFGSKFSGGISKAAKVGAAAFAATATAVGAIGKKAITAYADTEQLVGGVAKLYGNMGLSVEDYAKSVGKSVSAVNGEWKRNEKAQQIVMENAKNAFRTAGVSANEYMESATTFSAALINSLGGDTEKAAKQTDVAMRAISDNYNTFGGDMGSIQYAFQGFAKQNYTMLDNLKLGYGGTKTEMQRLIDDANTWAQENGKAANLSIDSFSDVVTAIDYIQQKQNIAGTTAREASTTIAGSVGMVKAAYENLMAGFANPDADISQLVSDLVTSVGTAAQNILPAIQQFATGFGQAITELAPTLINGIPNALSQMLPLLMESTTNLISTVVSSIGTAAPKLLEVGKTLLTSLANGVSSNATTFISSGMNLLLKFSTYLRNAAKTLIPIALSMIQSLAQGIINNIPTFIKTVPTIIENFANIINDNAPKIIATGISILKALAKGIISAIPVLIANLPKIIKAAVAVFKAFQWANLGRAAIKGIARGLAAAGRLIKSAITKPISLAKSAIIAGFAAAKDKAVSYMEGLKNGVKKKITSAKDTVKKVVDKIKGFFPLSAGKIFSGLKLPHFTVKGGKFPFGVAGKGSVPHWSVSWYKKAEDNPYMFSNATLFGAGEGTQDEILYGKKSLMNDISQAVGDKGRTVTINNYIEVNGAEDPEAWTNQFVRTLEMNMRMA